MFFTSWLRKKTPSARPTTRFRPHIELLESRSLPSTYYAATASDLIADINAANAAGGANTIVLTASGDSPYVLTAVNNTTEGANGLPVISGGSKKVAADNLTIIGNGDTIDGRASFRLFEVAKGGELNLWNATLQNGYAFGSGAAAHGGAINNHGTLVLSEVLIENNRAEGVTGVATTRQNQPAPAGQDAAGGGIWSDGSLTVQLQTVIQGNSAIGGNGGYNLATHQQGPGGNAFGGGICIAGGTANLSESSIGIYYPFAGYGIGNTAQGGSGYGNSNAYGGGIYVGGGTVTLDHVTVEANTAQAGSTYYQTAAGFGYGGGLYVAGGSVTLTNDSVDHNLAGTCEYGGTYYFYVNGYGGGIFIAPAATVYLDSFTVANTIGNTDQSGTDGYSADIDGTYILLP